MWYYYFVFIYLYFILMVKDYPYTCIDSLCFCAILYVYNKSAVT